MKKLRESFSKNIVDTIKIANASSFQHPVNEIFDMKIIYHFTGELAQ
jgi:hypothetical protein